MEKQSFWVSNTSRHRDWTSQRNPWRPRRLLLILLRRRWRDHLIRRILRDQPWKDRLTLIHFLWGSSAQALHLQINVLLDLKAPPSPYVVPHYIDPCEKWVNWVSQTGKDQNPLAPASPTFTHAQLTLAKRLKKLLQKHHSFTRFNPPKGVVLPSNSVFWSKDVKGNLHNPIFSSGCTAPHWSARDAQLWTLSQPEERHRSSAECWAPATWMESTRPKRVLMPSGVIKRGEIL